MSSGISNTLPISIYNENLQINHIDKPLIVPSYYLIDTNEDRLVHEELKLADNLEDFLIESMIQDIFYSDNYLTRVSAIQQLYSWIYHKRVERIFKIIAKNDKNEKIREFALQLLQMQ